MQEILIVSSVPRWPEHAQIIETAAFLLLTVWCHGLMNRSLLLKTLHNKTVSPTHRQQLQAVPKRIPILPNGYRPHWDGTIGLGATA